MVQYTSGQIGNTEAAHIRHSSPKRRRCQLFPVLFIYASINTETQLHQQVQNTMYYSKAPIISSLLLVAITTLHALPSPPSSLSSLLHLPTRPPPPQQQQPNRTILSADRIYCFVPGDIQVFPITPELCPKAIDFIILRDGIEIFTKNQTFYFGPNPPRGSHDTPDAWAAEIGPESCEVLVANGKEGRSDVFALSEVAVMAQKIVDRCVGSSPKETLGGVGEIGNGKGFFVTVNGKGPDRGVHLNDVTGLAQANSGRGGLEETS
ncbi:MAG: hypothetical protein Q9217_006291 [Psora testacea]